MKKFTVIVCCYNSELKIEKMLTHLLKCDHLSDLVEKVLVVDNNSCDNTGNIVKQIAKNNTIVELLVEPQQGLSNARRCGVLNTNTEWIVFLDDDNYVDTNWFKGISDYIENKFDIGVFNGNVVPMNYDGISEEQLRNLRASYTVLACTHITREAASNSMETPFRVPIGAGMVIKTAPLKELLNEGWLSSAGRTGRKLTSGEDAEMSQYVISKGYKAGFCPEVTLEHDIGLERMETDYLNRLWFGNGAGAYVVSSKYSKPLQLCYLLLLEIRLLVFLFTNHDRYAFYRKFVEGYKNAKKK